MSTLIANANGNLTGTNWANVSTTGLLDSEGGSTTLTTSNQDSATFVLEANQIDGIAIKLATRAAAPTGTVTITLRNSTTATNIWSITLNQSDFNGATTTDNEGGWYFINGGAPHTPNGTDSYLIRLTESSATNTLAFYTNGTTANWSRMVRRTNAVAPAAGDVLHIIGEWTAAATKTDRTITMDSTATTAYGAGTTGANGQKFPGLGISKGGSLTYAITASTNFVLRLNGSLTVWSGGTFNCGTIGSEMPRTSTAVLEFSCAADNDFGIFIRNLANFNAQGLSRTSGKNVVWTLLTADASAAATSVTVADDTGWLNGDAVAIGSTSLTVGDSQEVTLGADATSTTLPTITALSAAHKGAVATLTQAEVILLTRNVKIRATNASFGFAFDVGKTALTDLDWVEIQYGSNSGGGSSILLRQTTGTFTCSWCSFRNMRGGCFVQNQNSMTGGTVLIEHAVMWSTAGNNTIQQTNVGTNGGSWTLNDIVLMNNASGNVALLLADPYGGSTTVYPTVTNIRVIANSADGISFTAARDWFAAPAAALGPFTVHSCAGGGNGVLISSNQRNMVINGITCWRNPGAGFRTNSSTVIFSGFDITSALFYGNASGGFQNAGSNIWQGRIRDFKSYGDTAQAQSYGILLGSSQISFVDLRIDKGDFGTATGVWVTHSSADISVQSARTLVRAVINNTKLSSGTPLQFTYAGQAEYGSYFSFERYQQTATNHKTITLEGTLAYETTTVDVSPSLKMTPILAARKLKSNGGIPGRGFLVPVLNGVAPTVSLKVQKDGSYTGNAPRLIALANPAIGITADTVLATFSAGSGTWQTLSGALPSPTDDGVAEIIVDCDGTAGNIFVDTGTVA